MYLLACKQRGEVSAGESEKTMPMLSLVLESCKLYSSDEALYELVAHHIAKMKRDSVSTN